MHIDVWQAYREHYGTREGIEPSQISDMVLDPVHGQHLPAAERVTMKGKSIEGRALRVEKRADQLCRGLALDSKLIWVVSIYRGTPIYIPKSYTPYYMDPQKGTPNFGKTLNPEPLNPTARQWAAPNCETLNTGSNQSEQSCALRLSSSLLVLLLLLMLLLVFNNSNNSNKTTDSNSCNNGNFGNKATKLMMVFGSILTVLSCRTNF